MFAATSLISGFMKNDVAFDVLRAIKALPPEPRFLPRSEFSAQSTESPANEKIEPWLVLRLEHRWGLWWAW